MKAWPNEGHMNVTHTGLVPGMVRLGYPYTAVKHKPRHADYIERECNGPCKRTLKFAPLAGLVRFNYCAECRCVTMWRLI